MAEFKEFGKIARLNRDIVITEKLDGSNAAIIIEETDTPQLVGNELRWVAGVGTNYLVSAQSRNRILECGEKGKDNFGFAAWVARHKQNLVGLGVGYHYGEWYGQGIQRTYALAGKRFALFNVLRWQEDEQQAAIFNAVQALIPNLELVPLLYRGLWVTDEGEDAVDMCINELVVNGSSAVAGFMDPEGVVVFHTASRQLYKVTVKNDEAAKGTRPGMHNQKEENPIS